MQIAKYIPLDKIDYKLL